MDRSTQGVRLGRAGWAAFVIGLALSGFFDGILLHQVLQWHHFLSLVPGERFQSLETQVLADGLFHIFVYLITALGLWLLWRARAELDQPGARRRVVGSALLGFGAWNIVDVGLFHWILGIHRIRVNVPDPMLYDVAWLVRLGLVVALAGWLVLRGRGADRDGGRHAAVGIVAALLIAAPVANIPAPNGSTLVIFHPGVSAGTALNAVAASDSRLIAIDPGGRFAVVRLASRGSSLALYREGAMLVSSSAALAGCLAFVSA